MAQPYSDDLRFKLLEAYEAGAGSLRKLAAQFRVSWGYSKKVRVQQIRSGEKKRPVQQRNGPVSRMNSEVQARLRGWLREQPDLTEAELRERLAGADVQVSERGSIARQGRNSCWRAFNALKSASDFAIDAGAELCQR